MELDRRSLLASVGAGAIVASIPAGAHENNHPIFAEHRIDDAAWRVFDAPQVTVETDSSPAVLRDMRAATRMQMVVDAELYWVQAVCQNAPIGVIRSPNWHDHDAVRHSIDLLLSEPNADTIVAGPCAVMMMQVAGYKLHLPTSISLRLTPVGKIAGRTVILDHFQSDRDPVLVGTIAADLQKRRQAMIVDEHSVAIGLQNEFAKGWRAVLLNY